MRRLNSLRHDVGWALVALLFLSVLPLLIQSRVTLDFVIRLAAFGIFASSLNILVGYGGMVSFGHAMFFGSGAYVFGLLMQKNTSLHSCRHFGCYCIQWPIGLAHWCYLCAFEGNLFFFFNAGFSNADTQRDPELDFPDRRGPGFDGRHSSPTFFRHQLV